MEFVVCILSDFRREACKIQLQTGRIQLQYRRIQLQMGRIQLQRRRIQLQKPVRPLNEVIIHFLIKAPNFLWGLYVY